MVTLEVMKEREQRLDHDINQSLQGLKQGETDQAQRLADHNALLGRSFEIKEIIASLEKPAADEEFEEVRVPFEVEIPAPKAKAKK